MYCKECGTENRNDRKFCTNCGKPLEDYTKPKEDLIMPEEIKEKQDNVSTRKKIIKNLNIVSLSLLAVGVILSIISFFVTKKVKIALLIVAIVFYIIIIGIEIAKSAINKKYAIKNE